MNNETSIIQTNNKIETTATETLNTAKNYADGKVSAATSELQSQITQTANNINLSVSQNYTTKTEFNNLEVGGRNLVTKAARNLSGVEYATDDEVTLTRGGRICSTNVIFEDRTLIGEKIGNTSAPYTSENVEGAQVTLSFDYKLGEGGTSRVVAVYPYQATGLSTKDNLGSFIPMEDWRRFSAVTNVYRWTTGNGSAYHGSSYTPETQGGSSYRTNGEIWCWDRTGTNQIVIRNVKIERGAKATDWTPAPEDVESQIDSKISEAKLEIDADGIRSEVGKISSIKYLVSSATSNTLTDIKT